MMAAVRHLRSIDVSDGCVGDECAFISNEHVGGEELRGMMTAAHPRSGRRQRCADRARDEGVWGSEGVSGEDLGDAKAGGESDGVINGGRDHPSATSAAPSAPDCICDD